MNNNKTAMKKVLKVKHLKGTSNNGGHSVELLLECGHVVKQQASVYRPKRKDCPTCYRKSLADRMKLTDNRVRRAL